MVQTPLPEAAEDAIRRMAIVGQLTGGVVHDFNNILTVISGTIEILAEAVADRPDLAAIARLIDEAADRGANLTSHLLAFARGQSSPPSDVDVNAVLVEAARLLRPTLGARIEIVSVPATGVSLALVDPHQLMAAILHLAIMARDAMPEGGGLILEAGSTVTEEGSAAGGSEAGSGDGVMITVSAFRHGISPGHADRLFADLGSVNDFVRQSNGHVRVCSEAGAGTSVKIYLPRVTDVARPLIESTISGGDETILIVEDDALVRRYVMTQAQSLGYHTFAAANASEALAVIDQGEKIDLLFTDVVLPGSIDGWQLALEASNRRPLLKVLYTSGYARNAIARCGYHAADALLLAKPYRKVELAKMIRAALTA
jgi:CheY-like chemotaxis protein